MQTIDSTRTELNTAAAQLREHRLRRAPRSFSMALYRLGLGGVLQRLNIMVLTTQGRKSGQPRHVPVEFRQHGSKVYVLSLRGKNPQWYNNLLANPAATLRIGGRVLNARAEPVENPAEALSALHLFRRRLPRVYNELMAQEHPGETITPRTLPAIAPRLTMMRLDIQPDDAVALPPLRRDLAWLWALLPSLSAGLVMLARLRRR